MVNRSEAGNLQICYAICQHYIFQWSSLMFFINFYYFNLHMFYISLLDLFLGIIQFYCYCVMFLKNTHSNQFWYMNSFLYVDLTNQFFQFVESLGLSVERQTVVSFVKIDYFIYFFDLYNIYFATPLFSLIKLGPQIQF